jgi:hypothetical protein
MADGDQEGSVGGEDGEAVETGEVGEGEPAEGTHVSAAYTPLAASAA